MNIDEQSYLKNWINLVTDQSNLSLSGSTRLFCIFFLASRYWKSRFDLAVHVGVLPGRNKASYVAPVLGRWGCSSPVSAPISFGGIWSDRATWMEFHPRAIRTAQDCMRSQRNI